MSTEAVSAKQSFGIGFVLLFVCCFALRYPCVLCSQPPSILQGPDGSGSQKSLCNPSTPFL